MAEIEGKKISGVPERTELTGNELYPFADSGSQGHVKGGVLKGWCATPIGEVEGTAFDGARGKAVEDKLSEGFIINHYLDSNLSNGNEVVLTRIGVSGESGEKYYAQDTIPSATTTKAGVMSASDKKNLDNVVGLYYITRNDDWEQKIKEIADNSDSRVCAFINSGSGIPGYGLAAKNDNIYFYGSGGIFPAYMMSGEEEYKYDILLEVNGATNIDDYESYFNIGFILKAGGDGSKFLGDDGEYHSVSEGLTVPMTVDLYKYISEGTISDLDALDVELSKLKQLGGFVYWEGELWHCTIGDYNTGIPQDVSTVYVFAQLNLFNLYTGMANSYNGTYRIESAPTLRYVTVLILSDGSIVNTNYNGERIVLNNIVCTSAEDILISDGEWNSTISESDYNFICHEFSRGHILKISKKFFYPVLNQGNDNNVLPIFSHNDGNNIESIQFSWNEEASNCSVIHESLSLPDTYATKEALATKQDVLVSGTNIKTVNGQSILGEGNINIEVPEGGITDAPSDGSTYGRNNGAWIKVEMPDVSEFITETEADGKYATPALVDSKVAALVNSAPATLDTLKELADALGNDANFSTTITTKLGEKVDKTTYESDKAGFATKTELANKLDTSTYNSDKENFVTSEQVQTALQPLYQRIVSVHQTADNPESPIESMSFTASPYTYEKIGTIKNLTILGFSNALSNTELAEYAFEFKSGDTPTVLTMPESVKWIGDHTIEANKTYQVSIVNNLAVMGGA